MPYLLGRLMIYERAKIKSRRRCPANLSTNFLALLFLSQTAFLEVVIVASRAGRNHSAQYRVNKMVCR